MSEEVENHIRQNHPWSKLPANIKQILGNSPKEYDRAVLQFSVKNQLRYKTNLVRTVKKDEKRYYEDLLQYSQEHLMLYPYHLSDIVVKGLRVTPFTYYINMMADIMTQEKSYDSLPNFTAADCLRLLGIGRNQYIDLMNQCRSSKKFFRRKPPKDLLPTKPIEAVSIDPWWVAHVGFITEDDMKSCLTAEKEIIDRIIDLGAQSAGELNQKLLHNLYRRGLVYLEVPINDEDCIIVPPLENFVMNRVLEDYFEKLLYKIFVSIDEHTTVAELSNVLEIDLQLVKMAVSMYCRLGFARKKGVEFTDNELHPSWREMKPAVKKVTQDQLIIDWGDALTTDANELSTSATSVNTEVSDLVKIESEMEVSTGATRRIAFLFDSTLTAFLMMGNLSPGLKSHAVTMFEVGKLSDESLDSFLSELEKVGFEAEGEARRYFVHALMLRDTVRFLRYNKNLCSDMEAGSAVDLIRCESLLSLEPSTRSRVLNKNYSLLVSMAPLSYEIQPVSSCTPQHIGPAIPEVNSVWFKLYVYSLTGCGPPSLLLVKGTKLHRLPKIFLEYDRLLVTTWGHDPGVIATSNILLTLNDALSHSAVFVQAHGWMSEGKTVHIPFPLDKTTGSFAKNHFQNHSAIQTLRKHIDLEHLCGYITLINTGRESRTIWKHEEDEEEMDFNVNCMSASRGSLSSGQSAESQQIHLLDEPLNGVKDHNSAAVLASEIDLLEESMSKRENSVEITPPPDSSKLSLELQSLGDSLVENEWSLLECYFGIPLFEPNINKQICDKIVAEGLFNGDNLQELLQSGRKLSLRLLNFISQYQDTPSGFETLEQSSTNKEQSVPYPTQCLFFNNGVLQRWDNQCAR